MKKLTITIFLIITIFLSGCSLNNAAQEKEKFTIMWSIYAGWMPWPYAEHAGILEKWADKYNINIELKQADYIPSIEAYVSGAADGIVMTNMEALNFAGTAGIDTTAVIVGDYSNGNDALITRDNLGICDLENQNVYLSEFSVSHYLLARGFEKYCNKTLQNSKVNVINTSDSDIGPVFVSKTSQKAVVTWNPIVLEILDQEPRAKRMLDSSEIPYEILDVMFVNTQTLNEHPELGKALVGAWYETLAIMQGNGEKTESALQYMAERSGTNIALYKKQLETTHIWWQPKDGLEFVKSHELKQAMQKVAEFSFQNGLYGTNAKSEKDIGIAYPDGSIFGDKNNVKLRFTDMFINLATENKL